MGNSNDSSLAQANSALRRGDLKLAYDTAVRLLKQESDNVSALMIAGSALMLANKPAEAAKLLLKAKAIAPQSADISASLSRCHLMLMDHGSARCAAIEALQDTDLDPQSLVTASVVLSHCGDHLTALSGYQRAAIKQPENAELMFNLGSAYKYVGNFENAESSYERAISLKPNYGQALAALADIPNPEGISLRIKRLEELLANSETPSSTEEYVEYSLAREFERLGDFEKAFAAFSRSADARKSKLDYSVDKDTAIFSSVKSTFNAEYFANTPDGSSKLEPIFIMGMPRTGTTLLERILSSHSSVSTCGELNFIPALAKKLSGDQGKNAVNPEVFKRANQVDVDQLANKYRDMVHKTYSEGGCFIDKLPINYFYAGLISKAFPTAKIIIMRRNPLDTCLSNFRLLFAASSIHQYYSNSLTDCATYYAEFDELVAHWKKHLGDRVQEIWYENLVNNPEDTIAGVLDDCGLEWESACLDFHNNPQPLATASAYQARQPIYREAASRADQYGTLLQPAIDIFIQKGLI